MVAIDTLLLMVLQRDFYKTYLAARYDALFPEA